MNVSTIALATSRILRRGAIVGLAVAFVASACSSGAATAPAATSGAKTAAPAASAAASAAPSPSAPPVVVQLGLTSNTQAAPLFVGVEKGIYLKHGIDLKMNIVAAGADAVKGLQGGTFQVITNSWSTITPAIIQGMPAKIFTVISGRPDVELWDGTLGLIARPGSANTIAELKGMTIGAAPGAVETWVRAYITKAGLDPNKDVKIINIAAVNTLASIQSKAADAIAGAEPYISQTASLVPGSKILAHGGGIVDARQSFYALDPWMKANPKLVEGIIKGNLESMQYSRQHIDEVAVATSHYLTGLDPKILEAALKFQDWDPRWSDKILVGWDAATKLLLDAGTIKTAPKATEFIAMDLITGAQKSYPQFFTDLK